MRWCGMHRATPSEGWHQNNWIVCCRSNKVYRPIDHFKWSTFYDKVYESALLIEIPRLWTHLEATEINLKEGIDSAILNVLTFMTQRDYIIVILLFTAPKLLFATRVSVISCRGSCSKLKLMKNNFSDLAILSVDLAKGSYFDEVNQK